MERTTTVSCPACKEDVEVVVREVSVNSKGNGILEATIEASSYKHKCANLGGKL